MPANKNKKELPNPIELTKTLKNKLDYLEGYGYWHIDDSFMKLIHDGANPMTKSKDGNTLLTIAAQMAIYCDNQFPQTEGPKYLAIVTDLVKHYGVSMDTPNNKNTTPFKYLLDYHKYPMRDLTPNPSDTGCHFFKLCDHKLKKKQYMYNLAFKFIELGADPETLGANPDPQENKPKQLNLRDRLTQAKDYAGAIELEELIAKTKKAASHKHKA